MSAGTSNKLPKRAVVLVTSGIITVTNGAAWFIEFSTNGGYFETQKKNMETRSEVVSLICLECVEIASFGLNLDRPQLQHWLLSLEHNRPGI